MAIDDINVYVGNIIHCNKEFTLETFEKGYLAVCENQILAIGHESSLDNYLSTSKGKVFMTKLRETQILIPGFVDTHIHAPQYPNIGLGLDKPLLDWLNAYTYPLESKYNDINFAKKVYNSVIKQTLNHGTTTACYFATLFSDTSIILADIAELLGQRIFVGKVNMTQLAPPNYIETSEELYTNTKYFVEKILEKNNPLIKPIITPRFVLSLTMDEMKTLAELAKKYDILIQSHISENKSEIKAVKQIFNKEYAFIYDEANLLTNKTVLAHGVYLSNSEQQLIAERGTGISHCASSNINLKSGLCDVKQLINAGIKVGLGTDVSGGSSVSIINAMRATLDTSIAVSFNKDKADCLNFEDVFYLATLGGAKVLRLEKTIGNFEVGKDFDALIVDLDVEGSTNYLKTYSLLELLQKFIYTGDDRNVQSVFVAGRKVK